MDHSQQLRQQYLSKARRVVLKLGSAVLTAADGRKLGFASRPAGIPQAQAVAAAGQSVMMRTYEEAFAEVGLKVAQILLIHDDLESRPRFLNARNTLFT